MWLLFVLYKGSNKQIKENNSEIKFMKIDIIKVLRRTNFNLSLIDSNTAQCKPN
jgi:hypothetical protein